jgi:hypothetical protein
VGLGVLRDGVWKAAVSPGRVLGPTWHLRGCVRAGHPHARADLAEIHSLLLLGEPGCDRVLGYRGIGTPATVGVRTTGCCDSCRASCVSVGPLSHRIWVQGRDGANQTAGAF